MAEQSRDFDFGNFRIDLVIEADKEDVMLEEGQSAIVFMREQVHDEKAPEYSQDYHPVLGWVVLEKNIALSIAEHMETVFENHYELLEKQQIKKKSSDPLADKIGKEFVIHNEKAPDSWAKLHSYTETRITFVDQHGNVSEYPRGNQSIIFKEKRE